MPKVISRRTHVGTGVGEVAGAILSIVSVAAHRPQRIDPRTAPRRDETGADRHDGHRDGDKNVNRRGSRRCLEEQWLNESSKQRGARGRDTDGDQGQRGALTADQQENVRRPRAECDAHTHLLGSLRHDPLSATAGLSPTGGISRQSL